MWAPKWETATKHGERQASQGLAAGDRGQAGALSGGHRDIAPEARERERETGTQL